MYEDFNITTPGNYTEMVLQHSKSVRASAIEIDFTVPGSFSAADDERDFRGDKGTRGQAYSLRETALFELKKFRASRGF